MKKLRYFLKYFGSYNSVADDELKTTWQRINARVWSHRMGFSTAWGLAVVLTSKNS
jgi:hypothetical protein